MTHEEWLRRQRYKSIEPMRFYLIDFWQRQDEDWTHHIRQIHADLAVQVTAYIRARGWTRPPFMQRWPEDRIEAIERRFPELTEGSLWFDETVWNGGYKETYPNVPANCLHRRYAPHSQRCEDCGESLSNIRFTQPRVDHSFSHYWKPTWRKFERDEWSKVFVFHEYLEVGFNE